MPGPWLPVPGGRDDGCDGSGDDGGVVDGSVRVVVGLWLPLFVVLAVYFVGSSISSCCCCCCWCCAQEQLRGLISVMCMRRKWVCKLLLIERNRCSWHAGSAAVEAQLVSQLRYQDLQWSDAEIAVRAKAPKDRVPERFVAQRVFRTGHSCVKASSGLSQVLLKW